MIVVYLKSLFIWPTAGPEALARELEAFREPHLDIFSLF